MCNIGVRKEVISMAVHHIHPHVMNNYKNRNPFNNNKNPFKNLDKVLKQNSNSGNGHSFTATYSNNNGHITRHFSKDGKSVDAKKMKNNMKQMHDQLNDFDHMFDDNGFFDDGLDNHTNNLDGNLDNMISDKPLHHDHRRTINGSFKTHHNNK